MTDERFPVARDDVPEFDTWWAAYPRKQGKANARKRWERMTLAERATAWAVLPAWCRYYATQDPRYVPHGSTWLNQQRWEDDVPAPAVAERKSAPGMDAVRRVLGR